MGRILRKTRIESNQSEHSKTNQSARAIPP